jgi:hypothetical protein
MGAALRESVLGHHSSAIRLRDGRRPGAAIAAVPVIDRGAINPSLSAALPKYLENKSLSAANWLTGLGLAT